MSDDKKSDSKKNPDVEKTGVKAKQKKKKKAAPRLTTEDLVRRLKDKRTYRNVDSWELLHITAIIQEVIFSRKLNDVQDFLVKYVLTNKKDLIEVWNAVADDDDDAFAEKNKDPSDGA